MLNKISEAESGVHTVHFPTVKYTPAKESKIQNSRSSYPRLIIASLDHFMRGGALSGYGIHGFHNGESHYSQPDLVFYFFWEPLPPGTTLSATNFFATKDLDELFKKVLIVNLYDCVKQQN